MRQTLCRCRVRLRALYLALGLKPIVQIVTVCPSALLVKFVGALLNLLLNRDQEGWLVRLRGECRWLFLDLVWLAFYLFPSCSVCRCDLSALVRFVAIYIFYAAKSPLHPSVS